VDSVGSKGLDAKAPEVVAFLKKFTWKDANEIGEVMLAIQNGQKPEAVAKQWISAHPDRVKDWTGQ
jgi:glycine betaine/proline transport system substrate-binding protein